MGTYVGCTSVVLQKVVLQYTQTVHLRLTRAAKNQIDRKMALLYPCVKCHGPMTLDYCCSGCKKAIHWFCSEGNKELNESKGHSAH